MTVDSCYSACASVVVLTTLKHMQLHVYILERDYHTDVYGHWLSRHVSAWECEGWACCNQKRAPKCGILSSKLRNPVCKEELGVWQCEAVSVWPARVTCLVAAGALQALAVKEQVTMATLAAKTGAGRHGGGGCRSVGV